MRKEVRGQSSVEFLLVTAVGLLLLTSVSFFFLQQNHATTDTARLQQATDAGIELLQRANYVYSLGPNNWDTVEVILPEDVYAIYTVENDTLVFEVGTKNGIVAQPVFSTIPISGINISDPRSPVNNNTPIHQGISRFRVVSTGNLVTIAAIS